MATAGEVIAPLCPQLWARDRCHKAFCQSCHGEIEISGDPNIFVQPAGTGSTVCPSMIALSVTRSSASLRLKPGENGIIPLTLVFGKIAQICLGAMVLIYLGPNFAALPLDAAPGWYLALRRQPERQTCLLISAAQHGR
jgi:hypothetical protein